MMNCFSRMNAVRDDIAREAMADAARDTQLLRVVSAVANALEGEEARDAAELPWLWFERAVIILGALGSAWLARGGLRSFLRRCRCWRASAAPSEAQVEPQLGLDMLV
jgi:hypothetical protein